MKKIKKINRKWAILAVFNVGFITASISTSIIYSKNVQDNQQNNKKSLIFISYFFPLVGLILYYTTKEPIGREKENYAQAGTMFILSIAFNIVLAMVSNFLPYVSFVSSTIGILIFIFDIIAGAKSDAFTVYEIPAVYNLSKKIFKLQ